VSGAEAVTAKRRDALRDCLEEAIGRDLAAGVTRTALRLASVDEPPNDDAALRLYVEGPLAAAVAEALGRDAATALVHIVRSRLFSPPTLPPPARSSSSGKTAVMPVPAQPSTTSAIRRSEKRFTVVLRCADALRRSERARSLVSAQCDVVLVSGVDDVTALRGGKANVDLAVVEIDGVDAERIVREISDALHPPFIALVDTPGDQEVVRLLRAAGVQRFALLPKSSSTRELVESVSELLVGFVRSR
jgi:hypothetical protein